MLALMASSTKSSLYQARRAHAQPHERAPDETSGLGFVRGLFALPVLRGRMTHCVEQLEIEVPRTAKTWADKKRAKPPHTVILDKDFAGVPAGARLLISCPVELEDYLRRHVPSGTTKEIQQVRRELASLHGADATCPVSTSIFLRTVAEAAWDEIQAGKATTEVAPFWRVIDPKSPLAKKLRAGSQWIEQQRLAEL